MQQGSVILTSRKFGPEVFQVWFAKKKHSGHRNYHKRMIGTVQQYPDAQAAREVTTALVGHMNAGTSECNVTVEQICEHFEHRELRSGDSFGASPRSKLIGAIFANGLSRAGVLATWTKSRLWTSKHGCDASPWLDPHVRRFEASCPSCLIMPAGTKSLTATRCGLSVRAQNAGVPQTC